MKIRGDFVDLIIPNNFSRQNLKRRHHRGFLKKVHGRYPWVTPWNLFISFHSDLGMPTLRKCHQLKIADDGRGYVNFRECVYWLYIKKRIKG